jgi:hypothetical protein
LYRETDSCVEGYSRTIRLGKIRRSLLPKSGRVGRQSKRGGARWGERKGRRVLFVSTGLVISY